MAKLIREPINITVEPLVRVIMRRHYSKNLSEKPFEVSDIQTVIKALSHQCQTYAGKIRDLEMKIKTQKSKLTELEIKLNEKKLC